MPYKYRAALKDLRPNISGKVPEINRLMANENPFGCSPKVKVAVADMLERGASNYPDGYTTELREELAAKYGIDKDMLLFGSGADEIIYMLGKAFLEPGDEVVMPRLSFISYIESTLSMGAKMVYAPMNDDFSVNLDAVLETLSERTKYIVIVNPNNPTGTVFKEDALRAFLGKVPKDIVVIMDEAYAEFYLGDGFPRTYSMLSEYENLVILKTFSKIYGLASFRVGFMAASKGIVEEVLKVKNMFNVSGASAAAASAALSDNEFAEMVIKRNDESRNYLYAKLDEMGVSYIKSHTSFVLINVEQLGCKEVAEKLREKGYLIRRGSDFGLPTHIRVSMGTMEQMEGFVKAFGEVIK